MIIRRFCTKCARRVTSYDRFTDNLRWVQREDDLVGGLVEEPHHVDCNDTAP